MASNCDKKIVIIGAGLGGLSAAISLALRDIPCISLKKTTGLAESLMS
jgi:thioredoxin reductase